MQSNKQAYSPWVFISMMLFVVIGLVYANSLQTPFYYDDFSFITGNSELARLSNITALFNKQAYYELFQPLSYRPVTFGIYLLLKQACGDWPLRWRLFNLFLHFLNCCLFFSLLQRCGFSKLPAGYAYLAALIFAVHPVHTEMINIISFNPDLIGSFFCLLAFNCYFKANNAPSPSPLPVGERAKGEGGAVSYCSKKGVWWFLGSVSCYLLSCFAKEAYVVFPILCLIFAAYEKPQVSKALFWGQMLIYFLAAGLFLYVAVFLMKSPNPLDRPVNYYAGSLANTLLTFAVVLIYYLKLFFWPTGLTPVYDYPVYQGIHDWRVASSLLLLGGIALLLLYGFWRRERFAPYLLWFFVALLPTANIIPFWTIIAERYLYLPFMGLVAGGLLLLKFGLERLNISLEKPLLFGGLVFCLMLGVFTIKRNIVWQDPKTLWEDTLGKVTQSASKPQMYLGDYYYQRKEYLPAITHYQEALKTNPFSPAAFVSLGNIYKEMRMYREAKDSLEEAMIRKDGFEDRTRYYNALMSLVDVCLYLRDYPAALKHLQSAKINFPQSREVQQTLLRVNKILSQ